MKTNLEAIKAACANDDMLAIIKLASGQLDDIWAAAMTAHYGPCGIHQSWCDAEGRPTAEAIEKLPRVAWQMAEAKERIPGLVRCYERHAEIEREMDAIRMAALTA